MKTQIIRVFLLLALAVAPVPLAAKEEAAADKGKNYERLRERYREANQRKAREAGARDAKEYKREELAALEELYQKANANPRTPENQELLKEVVKKYPKSNRAGCAACYLGQFSRDAREAEKYLELAIKEYSDCYYFNGTSVGAWARYLLALREKQAGHDTKAKKLFDEIRKNYKEATDHKGEVLISFLGDK